MTTKAQKDIKPFAPSPRLLPRQTAASAARAARNATNRNLTQPASQRHSPPRVSPISNKGKTPPAPKPQKIDIKVEEPKAFKPQVFGTKAEEPKVLKPQAFDIKAEEPKVTDIVEIEPLNIDNIQMSPAEHNPPYIVEVSSILTVDETQDDLFLYGCSRTIHEINESDFDNEMKIEGEIPAESYIQPAIKSEDKSRPQTPVMSSRPHTPKSIQSSRPQTPRLPSRPTTPVHPAQRHGTPTSRPNTPQCLPPSRSRTPAPVPTQLTARALSPTTVYSQLCSFNDDQDLKSTYLMKQRQFHHMKKDLDIKQQAILEVFDNLRCLQERMRKEGTGCGEGISHQELVVFNVADWSADEIAQLCRDAINTGIDESAAELINTTVVIDECDLAELDAKVLNVPSHFADLCLQAFTARQEIIDWVKEVIEKKENEDGELLERISQYNAQGLALCDTLRELKSRADDAVDTVTQVSRRACRERGALIAVGESLVREVARLRQDLETRSAMINEIREMQAGADNNKFEELRRDLEEERSARNVIKDKLATTESQLRQARSRISKMDRQLRESEASIASLTGTVKTLEDQSRQREVQLEARARKLKESLKTGEVASNNLAQQRDVLQNEVQELKEQIENLNAQHKSTVQELTNQLKEMKNNLQEQRELTEKEIELKETAEAELKESQNCIEELKAKITELENSRPNPDLPSEREMDLWAELQATKDTLRITEEEVISCKREKVRFLESLTKITEPDNKIAMQQKLAAELISKEEIIGKMQYQMRELTKNIKLNEQKVIQYEQYVRDLQAHNRAVANCQEAPNGISYQDLQQEIMNLRMGLLDAVHRNEELSELLVQREQQLEQQDKTSRAQARVIKVREELINMLKNKETEQSRELAALQQDLEHRMKIVDEVNKQIAAKADEIQELFVTLENKQQQIHRLEKIVLALEEQQRRAQAQRTRHEEKIAALEHELAASGNRRERKFLFF